jgi:hypothetical protein
VFGGSTGSNGNGRWEKRAGGEVIEQWGTVLGTFGEGPQAVTFPIEFPTECEQIQVTAINASGTANHDIWGEQETISQAGAVVFLNYVSASGVALCDGFNWRAIGR